MIDRLGAIGTAPGQFVSVERLPGSAATRAVGVNEPDFVALLGEAALSLGEKLRQAEAVSVSAIKGNASMQEVVEQVTSAEQMLQASIAVRDKIVATYLEISRMSI